MQEIADVLESYSGYSGKELDECFELWGDMKDVKIKYGMEDTDEDEEEEAAGKMQEKKKTPKKKKKITFEHITRDRVKDLSLSKPKIETFEFNILSFPFQC